MTSRQGFQKGFPERKENERGERKGNKGSKRERTDTGSRYRLHLSQKVIYTFVGSLGDRDVILQNWILVAFRFDSIC